MIFSERTRGSLEMIRREQSVEACIVESMREPTAAAEKIDDRVWNFVFHCSSMMN